MNMFWLFFILDILVIPTIITAETQCRRFETLEVLMRFEWKRTDLPWTTEEAEKAGWDRISTLDEYSLDMYRFKEVNNLFIFFYKNNLAGVGPTFKSETLSHMGKSSQNHDGKNIGHAEAIGLKLKMDIQYLKTLGRDHMYRYSVEISLIHYNYALTLFINPNILKENAEDPCSDNMVFVEGASKGNWYQIATSTKDISTQEEIKFEMDKQGCLDRFGYYYFYSLSEDTRCDKIHGFFSFYDNKGDLSGFGAFYFGNDEEMYVNNDHPYPVYAFYNGNQIKEMVPKNKKCITSQTEQGLTAIHFFVKPDQQTLDFVCNNGEGKTKIFN